MGTRESDGAVEEDLAAGDELCQQIKIAQIASEDGTTVALGGEEDEGVGRLRSQYSRSMSGGTEP